jgi:uncharacterized protein (TIGR00661 family)
MRILYGVQATGQGHISRARAMAEAFRSRDVEVCWLFSGRPRERLFDMEPFGHYRYRRGLTFATQAGRLRRLDTLRINDFRQFFFDVRHLDLSPFDLVVTDYEPVVAWAARRAGVRSIGIGHQYAFGPATPVSGGDLVSRLIMRRFAPVAVPVGLHWHPYAVNVLPPILDLPPLAERSDDHVLVYLPFEDQAEVTRLLQGIPGQRFVQYANGLRAGIAGNVVHKPTSTATFKLDLRASAGVICNSGFELISYVRIAEGGLVAGPNNEINGLTLQGVGHGTQIDHVQVHGNLDDGIEWFGGTVNVTYAVLTNNDDDDIDFDEGYKGNIQYAIVRKNPDKAAPTGSNDPRGIEANSSDDEYVPETDAVLANVLVLGSDVNNNADSAEGQQPGMRLRGALTVAIYNSAVREFDTGCIRIDDADINGDGSVIIPSDVTLVNVPGECADGYYNKREADAAANAGEGTVTVDDAYALTDPGTVVGETEIPAVDNGSGFTFDNTSYIGAVEPGTSAANAWWAGWIIEGSLD